MIRMGKNVVYDLKFITIQNPNFKKIYTILPGNSSGFVSREKIYIYVNNRRIINMNQIATIIVLVIMGILGGCSTLYLLIAAPVVLIQKIYRKIRYGTKLTD